jgi:diaminopimelate epimerase
MNKDYIFAEACKNTFLIFDRLNETSLDEEFIKWAHKTLLEKQRDDALILIDGREKNGDFYAKMLVLGQDGIFGEFCGNGSRSCAAYLYSKYKQYNNFYLVTNQGNRLLTKYENNIYSILLPKVKFDINPKFIIKPDLFKKEKDFYFINFNDKKLYYAEAIEPHLVLKEKISDDELVDLGKLLNARRDIFPLGININTFKEVEKNILHVTTYERGVQRLTLSCGTGSSCTTAFFLANKIGGVKIITPGGELQITVNKDDFQLKGPATIL